MRPVNREYQQYLHAQLRRTLLKRDNTLPIRAKHFIDKCVEFTIPERSIVLCVGCRNSAELDYFRDKSVREVLGIDLQSDNQDILVMDMHAMTFPSESFDLVYSSHSLEHAHDPQQAVKEFLRVVRPGGVIAVEVPVNYDKENPTGDLYDFETLDNLLRLFNDHIARVLWQETDRPLDAGSDVIRVIIEIEK